MLFLLLGVGVLFPWNAFISAMDYFKVKYAPTHFPIEFALPLIYNYPNMILLLFVSVWGDKLPLRGCVFRDTFPHFSPSTRFLRVLSLLFTFTGLFTNAFYDPDLALCALDVSWSVLPSRLSSSPLFPCKTLFPSLSLAPKLLSVLFWLWLPFVVSAPPC